MSDYLTLVQDLHRECGAAGVAPAAVTGQTGEAQRLVKWIADADYYVKTLWTDWKFMWKQASLSTVASTAALSGPSDLNFWDFETFRIDGDPLAVDEYHDIRSEILDTSEDIPSRAIVMPDNSLKFEPVPDAVYTITADYWKKPTRMAANTDESDIPAEYHQAILGRALILYANYENAPEVKTQGEEMYSEALERLENHELPNKKHSRFKQGGHFEVIAQ